ncbi:MAG: PHP domain-containing protein [Oscillospiraceae bacterium]
MAKFSFDLHIHSCLSPCGDNDMLPSNIVGMAALKELDVIALTDHNSSKNCPAFMALAEAYGITAIPGMEINTSEEVHALCLFKTLSAAMDFDKYVHERLVKVENKTDFFGKQEIVDEDDNIIGIEPFLLINATTIDFYELTDLTAEFGGIMIPAHVDKSANSLISNLGFIPPDSKFSCAEVKHIGILDKLLEKNPFLKNCKIISNSDAHYLGDINEPVNFIEAKTNNIDDIFYALSH